MWHWVEKMDVLVVLQQMLRLGRGDLAAGGFQCCSSSGGTDYVTAREDQQHLLEDSLDVAAEDRLTRDHVTHASLEWIRGGWEGTLRSRLKLLTANIKDQCLYLSLFATFTEKCDHVNDTTVKLKLCLVVFSGKLTSFHSDENCKKAATP